MTKSATRKKYAAYLKSEAWAAKRQAVIFRDQGRCQGDKNGSRCGSRNKLEIHHLTYVRFGMELLTDLVCLCEDCHKSTHERKKNGIKLNNQENKNANKNQHKSRSPDGSTEKDF